MEKKTKKLFGVFTIVGGLLLLASCNSFCSDVDASNYMYSLDPINTTFFDTQENGEKYLLDTIKSQSNYDESISLTTEYIRVKDADTNEELPYSADLVFEKVNDNLYKYKVVDIVAKSVTKADSNNLRSDISYTVGLSDYTKTIISSASSSGIEAPTYKYFEEFDNKFLDEMFKAAKNYTWLKDITKETITFEQMYGYSYSEYVTFKEDESNTELLTKMLEGEKNGEIPSSTKPGRYYSFLTTLGNIKFYNADEPTNRYKTIENWEADLVESEKVTVTDLPSSNYKSTYQTKLNSSVSSFSSCITVDDGFYGHTSNDPLYDTFQIEGKGKDFYAGWGEAFSKHGFLEGLLVYPIATLVENLSHAFGMNGYGQICAVLLVTVIVRLLFMLVTFPSTLSQQKMTFLQPELARIQQKYPNANTNQYEKQKLAQAQMALYKKYHIHPFASFLVIFIQFPLFICVWNAFRGSASLSSDAVLGLRLSDNVGSVLGNFTNWPNNPGWWTALILFLLMSAAQVLAMLVPQWLNKARTKNVAKTGTNPAVDKQNKTMKYMQWFMTIMVVVMGLSVPSALGVYWFAGALFSIIQSFIMHLIFKKKVEKKG